jgi:general secretion pathway protein K
MTRCAPKHSERGAVLLTVLVLVTIVATLAVAMMDDIRFGVRRTANSRILDQASWYAYGAEELAAQAIKQSYDADPGRSTLNDAWAVGPMVFPVEGGVIEGRVSDASNCFNLNSVVEADSGTRYIANPLGQSQYINLLRAAGLGEGEVERLTNSLTDWIDGDSSPSNGGAEDAYYTSLPVPYRAANSLLVQVSELRALYQYTEDIYQRIRPYVCVLPGPQLSPLNVNTLLPEHAPLLVMLTGPDLELADARKVIADRPRGGYASLTEFWSHPAFAGFGVPAEVRDQVSVRTRFFAVEANVSLDRAYVSLQSILEQRPDGTVRRVARRLGDPS